MASLDSLLQNSVPHDIVLEVLLENTSKYFILVNEAYQIVAYSQRAAQNLRDKANQTMSLGRSFLEVVIPARQEVMKSKIDRAFQGEKATLELALPQQWLEVRFLPIWQDQQIRYVALMGRDVTPSKQAQLNPKELTDFIEQQSNELIELNQIKQTLLEAPLEIAFIATDSTGVITTFSHGAEKMLGYSAAEVVGQKTPLLFHVLEEVAERQEKLTLELGRKIGMFETFTALAEIQGSISQDWFYRHKNGQLRPVNLTITCIRNRHYKITGYLGIAIDISLHKEIEQRLQQWNHELAQQVVETTTTANDSQLVLHDEIKKHQNTYQKLLEYEANLKKLEVQYRRLFQQAPIMYITTRFHNQEIFISNCNDTFLNTLGYSWEEVIGQPLNRFYGAESQPFLVNPIPFDDNMPLIERVLMKRNGEPIKTLAKLLPQYNAQGELSGMWGIYLDMTQRLQAEQALRRSEQQYRLLARNIPNSYIYLFDHDLRFLIAEGQSLQRQDLALPNIEGKRLSEVLEASSVALLEPLYQRALAGEDIKTEILYRERYYYVQITPARDEKGNIYAGIVLSQDITEQKHIALALQKSEETWRSFVENAPNYITVVNRAAQIEFINRVVPNDQYQREQLIGLNIYDIVPFEYRAKLKECLTTVFATGEFQQGEISGTNPDGNKRWYKNHYGPIKQNGEIVSVVIISTDITEQKLIQEQLAQQTQALTRSNADLQDFAYIASHDLQEPLRKIQAFGARLQTKTANLDSRSQDYLTRMISAADRGQQLVQNLLAYSRLSSQNQPFVAIDLASLIAEVLVDLELKIEQTQAQIEIIPPFPPFQGDPTQMRQLFYNLINNALKFRRAGVPPKLKIRAEVGTFTSSFLMKWCHLAIEDNGIGIEEKYLEKIFAPFQRLHTRQEYEGNGMGLAICRKIVSQHQGHITVKSRPGEGSTFIVSLPLP